jgi:tRNA (cytidine32/uridine32-2'-O)-methyltransferase
MLEHVRVILVEPSHPGNIGASARAMKNMALSSLVLVQPAQFPSAEATARASGADDVLMRAAICTDLDTALTGCGLVLGASARQRGVPWPRLDARQAAAKALAHAGTVAFVFGREHSGLTNEELDRCNYLVQIPANPAYSSLNMAAAVQVIAYELFMALKQSRPDTPAEVLATAEQRARFYEHLEQTLIALQFLDPAHPKHLMRRLRRLYNRAALKENEINILRGILKSVELALMDRGPWPEKTQ